MQHLRQALFRANNLFKAADHMTYVSYPLLKDNKLFLVILKNLYMASWEGVNAVLFYEKYNRRIAILPSDFSSRMDIFEKEVAPRMKFNPKVIKTIKELKFIMQQHKESPVEFSRKDQFIVCNEDFSNMKAINLEMLKVYIVIIRDFLHAIDRLEKDV